jgi:hypothetical protein
MRHKNSQLRPVLHFTALCVALALTVGAAQATVLDLGSSGEGTVAGAIFSTTDIHPTGTGVVDPFLTVQNSPWEQGYNSSTQNFDTKRVPQWNHEIRLSDLRSTTLNGTAYYGFIVDINEPNGGGRSTISLDGLKIFISPTLQHSTSVDGSGFFNGSLGSLVFDLGANSVLYDDQQHGSGSGDLNIFIPVSLFAGHSPNEYIYMYQRWGNTDGSNTEGGFEETWLANGVVPIPELSTFFPLIGLLAAVFSTHFLRRRQLARIGRSSK